MVERKLSGVYTRREVEIPYEWFEKYVANMIEHLTNHALDIDPSTLSNNPQVVAEFEKSVEESLEAYFGDPDDSIGDPWSFADQMFAAEIKAKQKEQEEIMRQATIAARKENSLDKAIPIRPRYRAQAIELLKQAGLYDDMFGEYVERKLKREFGGDENQ